MIRAGSFITCWNQYKNPQFPVCIGELGRRGGLMVSALDSGASGLGSIPGRGHCVVSLGKTLYSRCLSPPRCINLYRRI